MISLLGAALIFIGSLIMLLAAIGILRLDDVWLRMHAASKSPSLAIVLMAVGAAIYLSSWINGTEGVGHYRTALSESTHSITVYCPRRLHCRYAAGTRIGCRRTVSIAGLTTIAGTSAKL